MSACTTAAFSVAPSINASGCLMPSPSIPISDQDEILADVNAVDLHHQEIEAGKLGGQPFPQPCARQRHKMPGDASGNVQYIFAILDATNGPL
jgi:hypothetical protein